jgi:RimJ/RimL family protein N-acetyltransferase
LGGYTPPECGLSGISVRQLERADLPAWFDYLQIPEVVEHTSWNVRSMQDMEDLMRRCEEPTAASLRRFAIVQSHSGTLVGTIGFHTISEVNRSAEIAFDLAPAFWGQGIAAAVCKAVTEWSFGTYGFLRVQATALDSNLRSQRVLAKSEFRYEGLLRAYRMVRGRPGDFKIYARLASD